MMTLEELLEGAPPKLESKGTYAAVRFDDATKDAVAKYIADNDLPNPISKDKMHCTVLYSRKYCPDYEPLGKIDPPWTGKVTGLKLFVSRGKNRDEEPKRCLVLRFDCDKLKERHEHLMDTLDATYDFPEYIMHITLSYDIGDLDEDTLPDITKAVKTVKIIEEYGEDLNLDWSDTASEDD